MVNLLILLANLAFAYIWGVWGWENSELYESGWWFDTAGHAVFGFLWAFILLYWTRKYLYWLYVILPKILLAFVIMALVNWIETQFWECAELLWDKWLQPNYFPHLAKAQKGSVDNAVDILVTSYAALVAMIFWGGYRKFYEWKWPNDAQKEAIEEEKEKARLHAREIMQMGREHRKQIMQEFRRSLKRKLKK